MGVLLGPQPLLGQRPVRVPPPTPAGNPCLPGGTGCQVVICSLPVGRRELRGLPGLCPTREGGGAGGLSHWGQRGQLSSGETKPPGEVRLGASGHWPAALTPKVPGFLSDPQKPLSGHLSAGRARTLPAPPLHSSPSRPHPPPALGCLPASIPFCSSSLPHLTCIQGAQGEGGAGAQRLQRDRAPGGLGLLPGPWGSEGSS